MCCWLDLKVITRLAERLMNIHIYIYIVNSTSLHITSIKNDWLNDVTNLHTTSTCGSGKLGWVGRFVVLALVAFGCGQPNLGRGDLVLRSCFAWKGLPVILATDLREKGS